MFEGKIPLHSYRVIMEEKKKSCSVLFVFLQIFLLKEKNKKNI